MSALHPRRRTLRRWLDSGEVSPRVDAHVDRCRRCASRLEDLAMPTPQLRDALVASMRPPGDLVTRLGLRMTASMRNRDDLSILLDLMGVPWHTARTMLDEPEDD